MTLPKGSERPVPVVSCHRHEWKYLPGGRVCANCGASILRDDPRRKEAQ